MAPALPEAVDLSAQAAHLPGRNLGPSTTGTTSLSPEPAFGNLYPNDANVELAEWNAKNPYQNRI